MGCTTSIVMGKGGGCTISVIRMEGEFFLPVSRVTVNSDRFLEHSSNGISFMCLCLFGQITMEAAVLDEKTRLGFVAISNNNKMLEDVSELNFDFCYSSVSKTIDCALPS